MAATPRVTKDITTSIGTCSFPKVFPSTKGTKDDGSDDYNVQFIIPKSDKDGVRAIMRAIKEVGEAKWGDAYKKVRIPLRDGDKESEDITDDGTSKGEKYPERLGCYFINARSQKPVGVVDRQRVPITDSDVLYGGCKIKMHVTFYPYSQSGNSGIGVALNGIQKVADGESFGGGRPSVESMFDLLEEDEDAGLDMDNLDDEPEAEVAKPAKKAAAKKTTAPTAAQKKAAAAKKAAAVAAAEAAAAEESDDDDADLLTEDDAEGVDSEEWDDL